MTAEDRRALAGAIPALVRLANALYPTALMPGWLQAISKVNPLSYEVDALRGLLIGILTNLGLDVSVLVAAAVAGVVVASALLPRLAK